MVLVSILTTGVLSNTTSKAQAETFAAGEGYTDDTFYMPYK